MKHLKLVMGLSYRGYGIVAARERPGVSVEDETAAALLETGYFEESAEPVPAQPTQVSTGAIEAVDTMGATKLRAYAKSKGLNLAWPSGTSADTIREDIRRALNGSKAEGETPEQFISKGAPDEEPASE